MPQCPLACDRARVCVCVCASVCVLHVRRAHPSTTDTRHFKPRMPLQCLATGSSSPRLAWRDTMGNLSVMQRAFLDYLLAKKPTAYHTAKFQLCETLGVVLLFVALLWRHSRWFCCGDIRLTTFACKTSLPFACKSSPLFSSGDMPCISSNNSSDGRKQQQQHQQ